MRKLFLLFAVVAGLFAFQGAIVEALPKEKARVELVLKSQEQVAHAFLVPPRQTFFVVRKTLQKAQVAHPHILALVISSIHHHSSL